MTVSESDLGMARDYLRESTPEQIAEELLCDFEVRVQFAKAIQIIELEEKLERLKAKGR